MGHLLTGQEIGETVPHHVGRWYEKADGVQFMLIAPAFRARDGRHVSQVLLRKEARVVQLAWRPETTRLVPGWWRRQWEKVFGRPILTTDPDTTFEVIS
jgi:hypothetical protein